MCIRDSFYLYVVPANAGTHTPCHLLWNEIGDKARWSNHRANNCLLGLWVPAFAGTTLIITARFRLRVPRFVRQHAGIDPDLAQRAEVFSSTSRPKIRSG